LDIFNKDVSERTQYMWYAIRSPRHGAEFGSMTLIVLICYAFATIQPVIVVFGVFFFSGMWLFWR
jgi:hypothetical protein